VIGVEAVDVGRVDRDAGAGVVGVAVRFATPPFDAPELGGSGGDQADVGYGAA
jgi:hypothetical protein